MKINCIKTKNEYIHLLPLNYKKSFNGKITNDDLQNMLNKYIEYLLLFFNMISHQISIFTRKIFFLDLSNSIFSQKK